MSGIVIARAAMDLELGREPLPPPEGMLYVDQANYALAPMFQASGIRYLYSDSATSCIVLIGEGMNAQGQPTASLAHLDSPECIQAYFSSVLDATYRGSVYIYAQGANPPDNDCSIKNANELLACLAARASGYAWNPLVSHMGLREGDPREKDRGDYGISIASEVPVVSTQPFALELDERDPSGGEQILYCIMRRHLPQPIQIRDARTTFPPLLVAELVEVAAKYRTNPSDPRTAFTYIIDLTSDEVLRTWSTTPEYEAPWFSDELKQSCCYTRVYLARDPRGAQVLSRTG